METVTVPKDVLSHAGNILAKAGTYEVLDRDEHGVTIMSTHYYEAGRTMRVGISPWLYGEPIPEHDCWDNADSGIAQEPLTIRCGICRAVL